VDLFFLWKSREKEEEGAHAQGKRGTTFNKKVLTLHGKKKNPKTTFSSEKKRGSLN